MHVHPILSYINVFEPKIRVIAVDRAKTRLSAGDDEIQKRRSALAHPIDNKYRIKWDGGSQRTSNNSDLSRQKTRNNSDLSRRQRTSNNTYLRGSL